MSLRLTVALLLLALLPCPASQADASEPVAAYYRGELESCLQGYREILKQDPWDQPARLNLAQVLRESGRPRDALGHLELLLCLRADDPQLRLAAAETALFAGQAARALELLQGMEDPPEAKLLRALALLDQGSAAEAAAALSEGLAAQDFQPLGWYWMGQLRAELGELDLAEAAFRRALAQEPNLTASHLPLARVYLAQGQTQVAYQLLRRAEAAQPDNRPLRELLQELTAEHPALLEEARRESSVRRETAAPRRAEAPPSSESPLPVIRIGLSEKALELHLKTGGPFRLAPMGTEAPAPGEAGLVLTVRLEGEEVVVSGPEGIQLLRSAAPLRLAYDDPLDTTILFDMQFGQGSFWAGSEDRTYRGAIELHPRPEGLTVVNVLGVEEYLYSVLPSEMPAHWPPAALQAQAVAARSYTMAGLGRFAARGFDLLGSVYSAAYRGMGAENPAVREAVDATRGQVLVEQGKPLPAYYSANCGGHTDTTLSAWGFPSSLPAALDAPPDGRPTPLQPADLARWLASRPESFCSHPDYSSRSAYRWKLWVSREQIESRLAAAALGTVSAVLPAARGASGRVQEVRILGSAGEHTLRWDAIRWGLGGLRSNLFTVEPKLGADGLPEHFVFTGAGWGHGVGMCQSGAAGLAAAGWSAGDILRHYYGEAALERMY